MTAPIVFLDTETTGLALDDDIWEIAAIRRDPDGTETVLHLFLFHDPTKCQALPGRFLADHTARFDADTAVLPAEAATALHDLFTHPHSDIPPHVVGAMPNFDTERLARLLTWLGLSVPWSYHLIDVEALALGYLAARGHAILPPWHSDDLTEALGLPITEEDRHTAMGDARWAQRIYDAVMGGVPEVTG